jgi:hypothetical protein
VKLFPSPSESFYENLTFIWDSFNGRRVMIDEALSVQFTKESFMTNESSDGNMITVRPMREDERNIVSCFVQRIMRKQYHCDPHPLPAAVFVGFRGDALVGAMALSLSDGEPFPLEEIYALDCGAFPKGFERTKTVELGRWVAAIPNLSEVLVYATITYALLKGCEWGIGEVKPKVVRRFSRMGLRIVQLSEAPVPELVPAAVRPYYLLPPPPLLCALFLPEAALVLQTKIMQNAVQKKMVIHCH